ncbi:hypothetical protein FGG08_007385 [Glutinoglossum americanum]|uniref:Uncharacterized protein n=1 Tax=Glutinoglossum americanum TaxID=1670608 RepID=A0A9P8I5F4_9PEZI|nr:hypothetical protein FGG08_007385 [Glutinoglossum americanum]
MAAVQLISRSTVVARQMAMGSGQPVALVLSNSSGVLQAVMMLKGTAGSAGTMQWEAATPWESLPDGVGTEVFARDGDQTFYSEATAGGPLTGSFTQLPLKYKGNDISSYSYIVFRPDGTVAAPKIGPSLSLKRLNKDNTANDYIILVQENTGRSRGFSLVEISIALGVFAFAILGVFGLLGVALDTSTESQRDSSLASVIRTVDSDIRSATDASTLAALSSTPRYFDIVGKPLTSTANAAYKITLKKGTDTAVGTMFSINNAAKLNMWSAVISYPAPSFPQTPRIEMKSKALRSAPGFTLVEMVVAMAIFGIMAVLIFTILNSTASITSRTSSRLDANRVARECLDLIGKDLKHIVLPYNPSNATSLQLFVNPTGTAAVDSKFSYPHSMFWQTPISRSSGYGNLAEVGYYVTRTLVPANPRLNRLQLRRLYVEPENPANPPSDYLIYSAPNAWFPKALMEKFAPDDASTDNSNGQKGWVADGVLAMWIRCLDPLGNPITFKGDGSTFQIYEFNSRSGYRYTDKAGDIAYPAAKIAGGTQPSAIPCFIEVALVCCSPADARRIKNLPDPNALPGFIPLDPTKFYAEVDAFTTSARLLNPQASALILTLFAVVMITLLTVTLLLVTKYERTSSALALSKARSEALADLAADAVMIRLKEATEDGMTIGKMWISEPGRIRVYNCANLSSPTDYKLFSAPPGPDNPAVRDEKNVDLNRPSLSGEYPIAPPATGKTEANMKVGWVNLLADPSNTTASASNTIVGRIAYWVDDESCKVNINTADGSNKSDLYYGFSVDGAAAKVLGTNETSKSFGFGTPTEISLQALKDKTNTELTKTLAAAISTYAWTTGFNSTAEIGRISNLPADFYKTNKFNITHYSKTPELTFYGEPRMYLMPNFAVGNKTLTALTGPYGANYFAGGSTVNFDQSLITEAIDFVYPTSKQLPKGSYTYPSSYTFLPANDIPQYALTTNGQMFSRPAVSTRSANFNFALRIAQALNNVNSVGGSIQWPAFGTGSLSSKYNLRQRDSIALQILDFSNNSVMVDHIRAFSLPSFSSGILGTDPILGVGRSPKLTEILFSATGGTGDPFGTSVIVPFIQPNITLELYLPKYYLGVPLNNPYTGSDVSQWRMGNKNVVTKHYIDPDPASPTYNTEVGFLTSVLNEQDIGVNAPKQYGAASTYSAGESSTLDATTYWMNNLLQLPGVDLAGNPSTSVTNLPMQDPDQIRSATSHAPYAYSTTGGLNKYRGTQTTASLTGTRSPFLSIPGPSLITDSWHPGVYHAQDNTRNGLQSFWGQMGQTSFTFNGGIAFCSHTASGTYGLNFELAPLDSMRSIYYTNEDPAIIKTTLQKAVIPVSFSVPVPGITRYSVRVADPLVNKFPGDWEKVPNATNSTIGTPSAVSFDPSIYAPGGNINDPAFAQASVTGLPSSTSVQNNPGMRSTGNGDPLSLWLPRQDVRYPKQSRFPSVGALNYVRTGMIPDNLTADLTLQHGTPWRSINLSSNTTSQGVYPDWAMLDLFTVPFVPQAVYFSGEVAPQKRRLTYGGATEGKININNPKIPYPFSETVSGVTQVPPERTAPLEALFYGLATAGGAITNAYSGLVDTPKYTTVNHANLRQAVQDRLATNGPFLLPGQLAEVPAINALTYTGVAAAAQSRNDLMRQVIGATTTQSNVFSIWIVAQTIKKSLKNSTPGVYEAGDTITGETRRRYLVERHLEFGKDGVPGNSVNPGPDGIVGTEDDPIDAKYHPAMTYPLPYRWRIISALPALILMLGMAELALAQEQVPPSAPAGSAKVQEVPYTSLDGYGFGPKGELVLAIKIHASSKGPLDLGGVKGGKTAPGEEPQLKAFSLQSSYLVDLNKKDSTEKILPLRELPDKPFFGPSATIMTLAPNGWLQLGIAFPRLKPLPPDVQNYKFELTLPGNIKPVLITIPTAEVPLPPTPASAKPTDPAKPAETEM